MTMTPGTYLRLRREAAGLAREDLAIGLDTDPPVACRTRVEWIESIEADAYPSVPLAYVLTLTRRLSFDPAVLDALVLARADFPDAVVPPICRRCGCSEFDPCVDRARDEACAWSAPDLCDFCAAAATGTEATSASVVAS